MGGFFGVASKEDCVFDLFFGTDYHSHLGTRRAGMAVYSRDYGFDRAIHNIENAPFRTKFDREANEMKGNIGIGSISDYEPQPLIVRSHHGTYSIATVGKINNTDEILSKLLFSSHIHFLEMSGGTINATELVATIINQKENLIEGIQYAQEIIDGSMTILLMTPKGIYAARDRLGRTPVAVGKKDDAYCVSFESFAYLNLGYTNVRELGPGEIALITPEGVRTLADPGKNMKICTFLWVYYGYPSSSYEGISVEKMRYNCGASMAKRDNVSPDIVQEMVSRKQGHLNREILAPLIGALEMIEPVSDIQISRDPDDDKFINCAKDARALYIVSGDKDLLVLRQYENIQIVTAKEFCERYLI